MDSLFRELKIYASQGQLYEPVDAQLLLSYVEAQNGQILEEGITEAGSMASWIAAATSYAHRGVPMVPFFIFYSMFGFQRIGDLTWLAGDARARGFLLGATAGRTTLAGEGLQHQDGHSLVLASTNPAVEAYDPAFAYEVGTIIEHGLKRMYGESPEDLFYYLTLYNENYPQPPRPEGRRGGDHLGPLSLEPGTVRDASPSGGAVLRHRQPGRPQGPGRAGRSLRSRRRALVGDVLFEAAVRGAVGRAVEPACIRENRRSPRRSPGSCPKPGGPIVAVSDFMKMVPDQIARYVPGSLHNPRHRRLRPIRQPRATFAASSKSTPVTW